MITKTKQSWIVGQTVKVGFLSLVVKAAVATPGDSLPENSSPTRRFAPRFAAAAAIAKAAEASRAIAEINEVIFA
jgi:hypothetical protein